MKSVTPIGERMKNNYENRSKYWITRRTNTIIRLDGKSFHSYTRNLEKPFDIGLIEDMVDTTKFLCENIQGCKAGYTQSDEISLLLTDYDRLSTEAFFNGCVQKISSVSASLATAKFNQLRNIRELSNIYNPDRTNYSVEEIEKIKLAFFDSRVFTIPEPEEVVNYFIWRQQDATRNSINMLAQSLYSHKELHKKNSSDKQNMCWEKGVNWNDLEFYKKRGSLILRREVEGRSFWASVKTPIFTANRDSILDLMKTDLI